MYENPYRKRDIFYSEEEYEEIVEEARVDPFMTWSLVGEGGSTRFAFRYNFEEEEEEGEGDQQQDDQAEQQQHHHQEVE